MVDSSRLHCLRTGLAAICIATLVVTSSTLARAAPLAAGARPPTLQERLLLREQWVRYQEQRRAEIRLGWPIVGLALGTAALGASAWLLAARERRAGVPALVIGLPLTVLSAVILAKKVKKRRAISREIWGGHAFGGR